ncbi:MAG: hypothetical protein ACK4M7_10430, partial [Burkholderiales bacterium]
PKTNHFYYNSLFEKTKFGSLSLIQLALRYDKHATTLQDLLKKGANPYLLMQEAIKENNVSAIKLLFPQINIRLFPELQDQLFIKALDMGNIELMRTLLAYDYNLPFEQTLIKRQVLSQAFLAYLFNTNIALPEKCAIIHWIISTHQPEPANYQFLIKSILEKACQYGNEGIASYILTHFVENKAPFLADILRATVEQKTVSFKIVESLIEKGADLHKTYDQFDRSTAFSIITRFHSNILNKLSAHHPYSMIEAAARAGHKKLLTKLLEQHQSLPDFSVKLSGILCQMALEPGNIPAESIFLLMRYGADPYRSIAPFDGSALTKAAQFNHSLLATFIASANISNNKSAYPLFMNIFLNAQEY